MRAQTCHKKNLRKTIGRECAVLHESADVPSKCLRGLSVRGWSAQGSTWATKYTLPSLTDTTKVTSEVLQHVGTLYSKSIALDVLRAHMVSINFIINR